MTAEADRLTAVVNVRVTTAEKAGLKEAADLAGLSVSEYVRRRALGRAVLAQADAVTIKELRRLGGLVKHLHNESSGAYSRETAAALVALRGYIEQLASARP
ncbi:MAG: hypothetical protein RLZZ598_1207 [Pseudomonadota bacterium]